MSLFGIPHAAAAVLTAVVVALGASPARAGLSASWPVSLPLKDKVTVSGSADVLVRWTAALSTVSAFYGVRLPRKALHFIADGEARQGAVSSGQLFDMLDDLELPNGSVLQVQRGDLLPGPLDSTIVTDALRAGSLIVAWIGYGSSEQTPVVVHGARITQDEDGTYLDDLSYFDPRSGEGERTVPDEYIGVTDYFVVRSVQTKPDPRAVDCILACQDAQVTCAGALYLDLEDFAGMMGRCALSGGCARCDGLFLGGPLAATCLEVCTTCLRETRAAWQRQRDAIVRRAQRECRRAYLPCVAACR